MKPEYRCSLILIYAKFYSAFLKCHFRVLKFNSTPLKFNFTFPVLNFRFGNAFYFFSSLGFLSKNGFLEEALTGMANTVLQSFSQFIRCAASPAENITRVSTRMSAAVAQAEPTAIPTSTVFKAHGTPSERPAQVGKPQ